MAYQELQISDFSAGITDKYVDSKLLECKELDNFLLNEIGLPELRPGYEVYYEQDVIQRIMGIFLFDDDLLIFRNFSMFQYQGVTIPAAQVSVPNVGEPFFQNTGNTSYPSADRLQNQLIVSNSGTVSPSVNLNRTMLVYKDSTGNFKSHEAGLPLYMDEDFVDATGTNTEWNVVLGSANINTVPPNSLSQPVYNNVYLYRVYYYYEYEVGNTKFLYFGDSAQYTVSLDTPITSGASQVAVAPINLYSIASNRLYNSDNQIDLANVKIGIARTKLNGTVFYDMRDLYTSDNYTDDELEATFPTFYTSSGSAEFNQPPKSRYAFSVNNIVYYLNTIDFSYRRLSAPSGGLLAGALVIDEDHKPYRFWQSIPGTANGVLPSGFTDLDDDITGGADVNGLPIIFTRSYIYRIEGALDSTEAGVIRPRVISDTIGCVSHRSIVNVGKQLFFAGNDGFYRTDGYTYELITPNLVDRYNVITANKDRAEMIQGVYDNRNERIYWACSDADGTNNSMWVLNLKTGGFTTASGENFFATALAEKDDAILRGDEQGYIYEHKEGYYSDKLRDSTKSYTQWQATHIPFKFETVTYNFGSTSVRKWGSSATITTKTPTKFAYKPVSNNDDGEKIDDMTEVKVLGRCLWGEDNCPWGDPSITWRSANTQVKQRHFPRGHARFFRKQIGIEPVETIRYISDTYGTADIAYQTPTDPGSLNITLNGDGKWPTDIVGDTIDLGNDITYKITSRNDAVITASGAGASEGLAQSWEIVGFNREQALEIKAISFKFMPQSREGSKFQIEESGSNG